MIGLQTVAPYQRAHNDDKKREELINWTIKIEMDTVQDLLNKYIYRKTIYTIYREHNLNYLYIQGTVLTTMYNLSLEFMP